MIARCYKSRLVSQIHCSPTAEPPYVRRNNARGEFLQGLGNEEKKPGVFPIFEETSSPASLEPVSRLFPVSCSPVDGGWRERAEDQGMDIFDECRARRKYRRDTGIYCFGLEFHVLRPFASLFFIPASRHLPHRRAGPFSLLRREPANRFEFLTNYGRAGRSLLLRSSFFRVEENLRRVRV